MIRNIFLYPNKIARTLAYLFTAILSVEASAQLRVPNYISDNMVLQRERAVTIRGWAGSADTVKIAFNNKTYQTVAEKDSTWFVKLQPVKAGGPYTIAISSRDKTIVVKNVLFGDVWFCSGQSNMNFRMAGVNNFDTEKKNANFSMIRQLDGYRAGAETPQADIPKGTWVRCDSNTIKDFSAVAFLFAKELYQKNNVPIGIINASWGGSPIQTFMSKEALTDFPEYKGRIDSLTPTFIKDMKEKYKLVNHKWALNFYALSDYISQDLKLTREPSFFDSGDWTKVHVPGYLEKQGIKVKNGVSWYKKDFIFHKTYGDDINIDLGRIKLSCAVFINGQFIGRQFTIWYNANYKIPKGILKDGLNEVLVCSYNENGETGFQPLYKPRLIINGPATKSVSLEGDWLFKQGRTFEKPGVLGSLAPIEYFEHQYPTLVYNSMIAPFHTYEVKGFLWYQGEDNSKYSVCYDYEKMLSNLIKTWRNAWGGIQLPFLIVQLANYHLPGSGPSPWTIVQEAQTRVGQTVPNTGAVVINDIGDALDIHPRNKQEVGRRLALLARRIAYGEKKVIAAGPTFRSLKKDKERLILSFTNARGGLVDKDGTGGLNAFFLAGKDNVFYQATARIEGDKVVVSSGKVADPVNVRYAFEDNPGKINFYNREGLPAVPFRTDTLKIN